MKPPKFPSPIDYPLLGLRVEFPKGVPHLVGYFDYSASLKDFDPMTWALLAMNLMNKIGVQNWTVGHNEEFLALKALILRKEGE